MSLDDVDIDAVCGSFLAEMESGLWGGPGSLEGRGANLELNTK